MKEYTLKPHQKELAKQLLKLDRKNLYYLVSQPNQNHYNHTLNEIKKYIKSGIKKYTQDLLLHKYFNGAENKLFHYIAFIEYPKEFYLSTLDINADLTSLYKEVHFHLFISPKSKFVNMSQLFYYIFTELSSHKFKEQSIRKFSYRRIDNLTREFAEYHTKQHYQYIDEERVFTNLDLGKIH